MVGLFVVLLWARMRSLLIMEKIIGYRFRPCCRTRSKLGWYSVHTNANDEVVRGATPQFFTSTILLPNGDSTDFLEEVCKSVDEAAREIGVCVVGGHTEVVPYLEDPLLCGTMFGETTNKLVLTSGAHAGDFIILTKHVGLEGAAILATDRFEDLRKFLDDKLLLRA